MTKYEVEEKTVEYLKTVFDPEIPVNVWDLGMIYKIDVKETAEPADGKDFDVDMHEAIAMVPGMGDDKKGKVIDCVQTGYTLNDKVIRHAKVAVGQ